MKDKLSRGFGLPINIILSVILLIGTIRIIYETIKFIVNLLQ